MRDDDSDFTLRPGKVRSRGISQSKSFFSEVMRAMNKAGAKAGAGRAGRPISPARSSFGRGRNQFGRSILQQSHRRVTIKSRIARHQGKRFRSASLADHVSYLKREGVQKDCSLDGMFDATSDHADGKAFTDRCSEDRHHFRFIICPEDASEMEDIRAFTRDLTRQMQEDLGTRLDWVAIGHWSTDNPHVHLLVRGVDESGADLVIARDYISRGMRSRAEDLVTRALGPKPCPSSDGLGHI